MKYLKVVDNPNLVRDTSSGGIINVDEQAYMAYKRNKNIQKQKNRKDQEQESRINMLENKITGMEQTLTQILDILKNDRKQS